MAPGSAEPSARALTIREWRFPPGPFRDRGTKNDHDHHRHCREKLPHIRLFEFLCLINRRRAIQAANRQATDSDCRTKEGR